MLPNSRIKCFVKCYINTGEDYLCNKIFFSQIEEKAPPPPPVQPKPAPVVNGAAGPLRSDASLGYASGLGTSPAPQSTATSGSSSNAVTTGSRPSAQVAPYSATPMGSGGFTQHSVISVDEGTSARGATFSSTFQAYSMPWNLYY